MNWLLRHLPILGVIIAVAATVLILLSTFIAFGVTARHSTLDLWGAVWLFGGLVLKLAAIGLAYGLFLRLLILCDDVAALRRTKTGTPSALD